MNQTTTGELEELLQERGLRLRVALRGSRESTTRWCVQVIRELEGESLGALLEQVATSMRDGGHAPVR